MAVEKVKRERRIRLLVFSCSALRLPTALRTLVAAALLLALMSTQACRPAPTVGDFSSANVLVNGRRIESSIPAIIVGGEVMVPLEVVDKAFGARSSRDPLTAKVDIARSEFNDLRNKLDELEARLEAIDDVFISTGSPLSASRGSVLETPFALACCNRVEADTLMISLLPAGLLGGSLQYIIASLNRHSKKLAEQDSVFLINSDYEPLHSLRDWPEWARHALPFTYEEITSLKPPFVWIRQDETGRLRAIVVINGDGNVKPAIQLLRSGMVPLDTPVSPVVRISAVPARPSASPEVQTVLVRDEHFEVEVFDKAYAEDASRVLEWMNEAVEVLRTVFPDALDRVPSVKVQLMEPSDKLPHGTMVSDPLVNPPHIRLTTPTLAEKSNPFFDRDYHVGTLAHEFMHCLHERYSADSTGLPLYDRHMPGWLIEGVAEYAKFIVLGEQRFHEKSREEYDSAARAIIETGLDLVNVYPAGAWVFRYMHHVYGSEKIISLLKSREALFEDALKAELGVSLAEFEAGLKEWLAGRYR